jgi:hydroxycarboxylate dehydrogenase B
MVPRYVKEIAAGELVLNQQVEVVTDTGSLLVIDAHQGIGRNVTYQVMNFAIERAKATGVCLMGLRNSHH